MTIAATQTRVLLLIEDNPGDSELVTELLAEPGTEAYQVVHAPLMKDAVSRLQRMKVDVVVLDLGLPDCSGVEAIRVVRQCAGQTPIVVLTGSDDDKLALECIDAGAQDYLAKSEARSQNLRRAIGYAITRQREAQVRELQENLERYRAMSSMAQRTSVTAALAGSGAISLRNPDTYGALVAAYSALFEPYLSREQDRVQAPREVMEQITTMLGDLGGGPRDLLDVHVTALDRGMAREDSPHSRSIVYEARLLALEMMGLLVDYYRVGQRRRHADRGTQ